MKKAKPGKKMSARLRTERTSKSRTCPAGETRHFRKETLPSGYGIHKHHYRRELPGLSAEGTAAQSSWKSVSGCQSGDAVLPESGSEFLRC